jgi:hypothetical protein
MHPWLHTSKVAEVPQTIEEMFIGWKQAQKLSLVIKAMMWLIWM